MGLGRGVRLVMGLGKGNEVEMEGRRERKGLMGGKGVGRLAGGSVGARG